MRRTSSWSRTRASRRPAFWFPAPIIISSALRLVYNKSAGTLKIAEYNDDGSGTATVGGIALPTNEWFTLRIEYYQTKVAETSMMKIFLGTSGENLKCVAGNGR